MQKLAASSLAVLLVAGTFPAPALAAGGPGGGEKDTATPIKHLVVIFDENISFDHYFGTYPHATNPKGEPAFHARPDTPAVNGLTEGLKINNPNFLNSANTATLASGAVSIAANPFRLDCKNATARSALTAVI